MKRSYTRWIWRSEMKDSTSINVGLVYNKSKGNPLDIIRVLIHSKTDDIEFFMRLDEAAILAGGLNKVMAQMLIDQVPGLSEYCEFMENK